MSSPCSSPSSATSSKGSASAGSRVDSIRNASLPLDGEAGREPSGEAADHVRRIDEPELVEADRGEARRIALLADEDEPLLMSRERRVLVPRVRIDPPFEDAERGVHRARDRPLARPNVAVPRVHERRAVAYRGRGLSR